MKTQNSQKNKILKAGSLKKNKKLYSTVNTIFMPEFPLDYKLLRAQIMSCLPLVLRQVPDTGNKWVTQSCPTLCDSMDYTVHGVFQARILEWIDPFYPFSRGSSQPRDWTQVSRIAGGFFTSWATREAQEYWSGQPIPSPVDLPDPGIEPGSLALQADSLPTELWGKPRTLTIKVHKCLWANWT